MFVASRPGASTIDGTTFEIGLDFVDHALIVRTADGRTRSFPLVDGVAVAEFDTHLHAVLGDLGIDVKIKEQPFGVPMSTPFTEDIEHASWDRDAIERFGRILDWTDTVLEEFSGWFSGKTSPVHLFWHSFDLAVSRFSGRPGPPMKADAVTREAYSQEVIAFGFWPGDDNLGEAAYYSYTAPSPPESAINLCPSAHGANGVPGRWPSSRTSPSESLAIPRRRCSRSARVPTRPARALPGGTRPASSRPGAPPRRSSTTCMRGPSVTSAAPRRARDVVTARQAGSAASRCSRRVLRGRGG